MQKKPSSLSIPCICPLITGVPVPIQNMVQGVTGSSAVGIELRLSQCLGPKCKFYLPISDGCCIPSAFEVIIRQEANLDLLVKKLCQIYLLLKSKGGLNHDGR